MSSLRKLVCLLGLVMVLGVLHSDKVLADGYNNYENDNPYCWTVWFGWLTGEACDQCMVDHDTCVAACEYLYYYGNEPGCDANTSQLFDCEHMCLTSMHACLRDDCVI